MTTAVSIANRRPRQPRSNTATKEPRRGRTEEPAVFVYFAKTKWTRRRGGTGCSHAEDSGYGCNPNPCISGFFSAVESAFRPDGDLLLSWQKKAKPPAPRFGPFGVPSTPAPLRGPAAYGSLRSPTSRACVARRLRCAQPPPRRLRSASLTSRFVSFFRFVFAHAAFEDFVFLHVQEHRFHRRRRSRRQGG